MRIRNNIVLSKYKEGRDKQQGDNLMALLVAIKKHNDTFGTKLELKEI